MPSVRKPTLGPLGELGRGREFPAALHPGDNTPRYPAEQRPAEQIFDLQNPVERLDRHRTAPEQIPPPRLGEHCCSLSSLYSCRNGSAFELLRDTLSDAAVSCGRPQSRWLAAMNPPYMGDAES